MDSVLLTELISIHAAAIALCAVLVYFMIKPYKVTGESRYLGLPLGFGFLGLSHLLSSYTFFAPTEFHDPVVWLQLSARSFAFAFLALSYYFAKKPSQNSRVWWNLTLSILIVALMVTFVGVVISPQSSTAYLQEDMYFRIFNVVCIGFISIHTLRIFLRKNEKATGSTAFGFIQLALSQFLLIFWAAYLNLTVFWVALLLLLTGLTTLVAVSYRAFHRSRELRGS
jgi:hypothetical protein